MSIWNIEEIKTKKEALKKDIDVDILIIGAGITGMSLGYYLKDNKTICIVDSGIVGHGTTLCTTAKINYLQERIYTKIKSLRSKNTAIKYLKSQKYAIESIKKIVEEEKINCDFKRTPSYVFASTKKEIKPLEQEVEFLREQGINIEEKPLEDKITFYKSYCVNDTYTFNPIKYLQGLYNILINKNIPIYENAKIIKIEKDKDKFNCYTLNNKITAKKVVFACHYPYFTIPFLMPIKSYIEKSYIIVSKVKNDKGFTCINTNIPTYSCRFYKDGDKIYQISLAESHNTAFKQNDSYHFKRVKEIFNLKDEDIIEMYTNTDIMTPDKMPYIGKLQENIYIGTGYNTWGMTNGVLAAKIISDSILNIPNEFEKTFVPNRFTLSNILMLPYITVSQTKSYLGTILNKNKSWYDSNLSFYTKNGKSLATYTDKDGTKHTVHNKCPHLGCKLIFNEQEKTWDCPCHSSRFNIDGKCIKGPSNYNISYKE